MMSFLPPVLGRSEATLRSGCLEEGGLDRLGHLDGDEPLGRTKVVLVDDPDISVPFRRRVVAHEVNAVAVPGSLVALVGRCVAGAPIVSPVPPGAREARES